MPPHFRPKLMRAGLAAAALLVACVALAAHAAKDYKIFGVGLSRTGTLSLSTALAELLGMPIGHYLAAFVPFMLDEGRVCVRCIVVHVLIEAARSHPLNGLRVSERQPICQQHTTTRSFLLPSPQLALSLQCANPRPGTRRFRHTASA